MLWRTISTAILIFACHRVATRDDDVDKLVDSQILKDPYPHTFTIFQNRIAMRLHCFRCSSVMDPNWNRRPLTSMDFHSKLWTKTASTDELVALSMGFLFSLITKDRIETTAGSWALQGSVVPRDAYIVHKSRKAGALLLAKAGMSEWAEIRKMDYSQGYAAFGGQGRSAIISLYTLVEAAQALRLRCPTRGKKFYCWHQAHCVIPISGNQLGGNVGKGQFATPHMYWMQSMDWEWGTKCGYANESKYMIMKVDFYNDLRAYLSEPENTNTRSLEDIVEYNYNDDGTKSRHPDSHPAWLAGQDSLLASLPKAFKMIS
ncbi:glutamyl-tRNA(Gln) amidotransferase subunit A [Coccidioides immitis RMSCC 3703]|uniref:Glutamyl-tRNA(Gln) amidotransferase subunit A n=1 Tax=Coccidioides immitis RMSCC 3703 TaxID=454286 RepID=A0A0J8U0Q2_COCIT|nr:glutamyl-tRNA(Gln) amidotransferase subunit A [Coccidioides immitis RMSCC 3703]